MQKGANINSMNEKGETPLHVASTGVISNNIIRDVSLWRTNCVQLLLKLGADLNALDDASMSPLNKACSVPEVMKMLVEGGAKISAAKMPPLFSPIQRSNVESVRIMLDADVSPNLEDSTRSCSVWLYITDQLRTPLLYASFQSSWNRVNVYSGDIIKMLIERGAVCIRR